MGWQVLHTEGDGLMDIRDILGKGGDTVEERAQKVEANLAMMEVRNGWMEAGFTKREANELLVAVMHASVLGQTLAAASGEVLDEDGHS